MPSHFPHRALMLNPADGASLRRAATTTLADLMRTADRWLLPEMRAVDPVRYRRQLLFQAPDGAYSIGCFVWGQGQRTPIHNHRAWGIAGVLKGVLIEEAFTLAEGRLVAGPTRVIASGECSWCGPSGADIHRVGTTGAEPAISLHIYGSAFDRVCGQVWEEEI